MQRRRGTEVGRGLGWERSMPTPVKRQRQAEIRPGLLSGHKKHVYEADTRNMFMKRTQETILLASTSLSFYPCAARGVLGLFISPFSQTFLTPPSSSVHLYLRFAQSLLGSASNGVSAGRHVWLSSSFISCFCSMSARSGTFLLQVLLCGYRLRFCSAGTGQSVAKLYGLLFRGLLCLLLLSRYSFLGRVSRSPVSSFLWLVPLSRMCAVVSVVLHVLETIAARCALPALVYLCEVAEDGSVLAGVELELPVDAIGAVP